MKSIHYRFFQWQVENQTHRLLFDLCMKLNMKIIKDKRISLIFLIFGAIGGFLYWKFVGCNNGTCAIKSVWYWSTLWGAALAYLVGDFINDILIRMKKRREKKNDGEV